MCDIQSGNAPLGSPDVPNTRAPREFFRPAVGNRETFLEGVGGVDPHVADRSHPGAAAYARDDASHTWSDLDVRHHVAIELAPGHRHRGEALPWRHLATCSEQRQPRTRARPTRAAVCTYGSASVV